MWVGRCVRWGKGRRTGFVTNSLPVVVSSDAGGGRRSKGQKRIRHKTNRTTLSRPPLVAAWCVYTPFLRPSVDSEKVEEGRTQTMI